MVKNPDNLKYASWDLPGFQNAQNAAQSSPGLFGRRAAPPKHHLIPLKVVLYDPNGEVKFTEERRLERKSFGERNKEKNEMVC